MLLKVGIIEGQCNDVILQFIQQCHLTVASAFDGICQNS